MDIKKLHSRFILVLNVQVVLLFSYLGFTNTYRTGLGGEEEVRLQEYLFIKQGYNPLIRPVSNINESVRVEFNMALIQIIGVDEKSQILKTSLWLRMVWSDYQLKWDPYEYGGISVIRVASKEVWKPDIVLFNNADGKYEVSYQSNVVISYTGDVLWIPPAIYQSSCTINVEYFPFDEQLCEMKFGSWTFNGDQVYLNWYEGHEKVDLSDYVSSGSWDIMSVPGRLNYSWDETDQQFKSIASYFLRIRRKTLFYTVTLLLPVIIISFLSVTVFLLPADAHEKMTMRISILLALVVFLVLVSKMIPPTSKSVPLISKYLLFTFILNIITIFFTVFVMNWNFRTPRTHRMGRWVRCIFLNYLPRVVFVKRPNHERRFNKKAYSVRHDAEKYRDDVTSGERGECCVTSYAQVKTGGTEFTNDVRERYFEARRRTGQIDSDWEAVSHSSAHQGDPGPKGAGAEVYNDCLPLTPETYKAMEAIRFIANHLRNEDDFAEIQDDWRYVADVADRLLLFIFLAVTVCGTIGILINAPNIFEWVDQDKIIEAILVSQDGNP